MYFFYFVTFYDLYLKKHGHPLKLAGATFACETAFLWTILLVVFALVIKTNPMNQEKNTLKTFTREQYPLFRQLSKNMYKPLASALLSSDENANVTCKDEIKENL